MSETTADNFSALDESGISRFQLKIMFVSGMGFFTDAYDLFVIGIVVALLKPEWGLSTTQVSLLNSVTLAASAVGAIVFGRIADMLGRNCSQAGSISDAVIRVKIDSISARSGSDRQSARSARRSSLSWR